MSRRRRDPRTAAEWQQAVDAAAAWRALEDCKMYGLLEGGPTVDVERCDSILERGAARGVRPSKPATELALEYLQAWNAEQEKGAGR